MLNGDIEQGFSGAGVSCTDAKDCTVVGTSSTSHLTYATETSGTWGSVQTLDASLTGSFDAVSCSDALDCTAVGVGLLPEPDGDRADAPVAATETNGTWGPVTQIVAPSVDAANNPDGGFDVSCTSAGNCVLAGYGYANYIDSYFHPIFATESGGSWGTYQVDTLDVGDVDGVSCPDANDCTAVGFATATNEDGFNEAIAIPYSDGSWGDPIDVGDGNLTSIDCTGASDCVAVNQSPNDDLFMQETDGSWNAVPVNNELDGGWLSSVSCTSADDCVAAGPAGYVITNTPSVAVVDNAPLYGETLTFTATVTGTGSATPAGSVSWNVQGSSGLFPCTSTSGPTGTSNYASYTCSITHITDDTYTATADFEGDENYAPASGTDQVPVTGGPPTITSFSPASGPPGTAVKIKGTFLDNATKVTINGRKATIASDSSTLIKIKIPTGPTTGKIKVKTLSGKAKTAAAFRVT